MSRKRSDGPGSRIVSPGLDPEVLHGVRRRDETALVAFYDHFVDHVYAVAYRFLGDSAVAEEATQEVFYRVHRSADRLDAGRDPGPWVMTLTLNVCRSIWRSAEHRLARRTVTMHPAEGTPLDLPGTGPDPDQTREERLRRQIVQETLTGLPESLREVVILCDYHGLDHQTIASILGVSHDSARKRYSRALEEMGRRMKGKLP